MKFIVLLIFFICINIVGFLIMFSDKHRAIRKHWRIPERTMFLVAILGGSIGTILGMWIFHHKTRQWYFVLGMPFIFLMQLIACLILV